MVSVEIGQLERVTPKTVWGNMAYEFVPWLAENIERLNRLLDLNIKISKKRPFDDKSQIIARDGDNGSNILIKCLLDIDDHTGMEQIIAPALELEAKCLIWIAPSFSQSQLQVMNWLNGTDSELKFYSVCMTLLRIGDSTPALDLRLLSGQTGSAHSKKPESMDGQNYCDFFQTMLDELRIEHGFTDLPEASTRNRISIPSGMEGITYGCLFKDTRQISVHIEVKMAELDLNLRVFNALRSDRLDFEKAFADPLSWEHPEQGGAFRIAVLRNGEISENELDELRQWSVRNIVKLRTIFGEFIARLAARDDAGFELPRHSKYFDGANGSDTRQDMRKTAEFLHMSELAPKN